jgi:hypothetical protein
MNKKKANLGISIGTKDRWTFFNAEREEKGYYASTILVGGVSYHMEAIEVKETERSNGVIVDAVNPIFQIRIDNFCERNEGLAPSLVEIDKKKYFINIEPYAQ